MAADRCATLADQPTWCGSVPLDVATIRRESCPYGIEAVAERRRWDDYQHAFSEMLSHTSTEWAPWFVIPADRKWFARIAASSVLAHTLMDIDPRFPTVSEQQRGELAEARRGLEAEAPEGAAPDPFSRDRGEPAGG